VRWERFELPDGDFVDLAWAARAPRAEDAPTVVILPGLGGAVTSKYARGLLDAFTRRAWRAGVLHYRGTSGVPNRRPRSYHAGETGDPRFVLGVLRARWPEAPLAAVGVSLGGSVLLNLLAETADLVDAAAAASVPLDLGRCARRLQRGFSRVYDRYLLRDLVRFTRARAQVIDLGLPAVDLGGLRTLEAFDDAVTAPLHGFASARDYYARSSAGPKLDRIRTPTLLLQARDDPFTEPDLLGAELALSPAVTLEVSDHGGHVGFVGGSSPLSARFELEARMPGFLASRLV
jgi:predicted alpha/beta-fold hydrolase